MRISDWSSDVCSSDLLDREIVAVLGVDAVRRILAGQRVGRAEDDGVAFDLGARCAGSEQAGGGAGDRKARKSAGENRPPSPRSEENTSELQSLMRLSYAVFCLKKKISEIRLMYTNVLY